MTAFNNIFFKHLLSLARPAGAADRSYLPIAGDSARRGTAGRLLAAGDGHAGVGDFGEDAIRAALATATR
ncbi:MAG TPA: hypothetical protein VK817_20660 [Trebonia sp.]|nr:hypothetical protein [Trebonia sp.]